VLVDLSPVRGIEPILVPKVDIDTMGEQEYHNLLEPQLGGIMEASHSEICYLENGYPLLS
jgi:hypothetical protein